MPRRRIEPESTGWITTADRIALMRSGIVVVDSEMDGGRRRLTITGLPHDAMERAASIVAGDDVDIDLIGDTPRFISPIRCLGHMEREPGRLQLRYAVGPEQHIDEILVLEDEASVVVYATACYPTTFELGELCDCPHHVYLDAPLAGRAVFDGAYGCDVPFRNVYADLEARRAV